MATFLSPSAPAMVFMSVTGNGNAISDAHFAAAATISAMRSTVWKPLSSIDNRFKRAQLFRI
jgi:hypothetical protein